MLTWRLLSPIGGLRQKFSPLCTSLINRKEHVDQSVRRFHGVQHRTDVVRPIKHIRFIVRQYTTTKVSWEVEGATKPPSQPSLRDNFILKLHLVGTFPGDQAAQVALNIVKSDVDGVLKHLEHVPIDTRDSSGNTFLHWAGLSCKFNIVAFLIEKGLSVNATNNLGQTPLFAAASNPLDFACIKLFVEKGAQLNIQDKLGYSPIHYAARNGEEIVRLLVKLGANVDSVSASGVRPLGMSVVCKDTKLTQALLDCGASPYSQQFGDGLNAFHLAAEFGNSEAIRVLAQHNKDGQVSKECVDCVNNRGKGFTPLELAIFLRDVPTVEQLLNAGADIEADGGTPLQLAVSQGSVQMVKCLVNRKANIQRIGQSGQTCTMRAALKGHDDIVTLLHEQGADINQLVNRKTALTCAVIGGQLSTVKLLFALGAKTSYPNEFLEATGYGHVEIMKYFWKEGHAKPDVVDNEGRSAGYYLTCSRDDVAALSVLADMGVDLLSVDQKSGNSALHCAASEGHLATIEALVTRLRVDVNIQNKAGSTALYLSKDAETVRMLLKLGAKLDENQPLMMSNNMAQYCGALLALVEMGKTKSQGGITSLHAACFLNRTDLIRKLVELGADLTACTATGLTPIAYSLNNLEGLKILIEAGSPLELSDGETLLHFCANKGNVECLEELVTLGQSVNARTKDQVGPLTYAIYHTTTSNLKRLLELGADIDAVDSNGDTALHYAVQSERGDAVKELVRAGARKDIKNAAGKLPSDLSSQHTSFN